MVAIGFAAINFGGIIFRILLLPIFEKRIHCIRPGTSIVAQLRRPWAAQS
jgi:hypothetical protein